MGFVLRLLLLKSLFWYISKNLAANFVIYTPTIHWNLLHYCNQWNGNGVQIHDCVLTCSTSIWSIPASQSVKHSPSCCRSHMTVLLQIDMKIIVAGSINSVHILEWEFPTAAAMLLRSSIDMNGSTTCDYVTHICNALCHLWQKCLQTQDFDIHFIF